MNAPQTTPRIRLIGWLLLVAWLCSIPGILPLAFATVAKIDGEHGVKIDYSTEAVVVVLTHGLRCSGVAHDQIHRHRLLGSLLTCFTDRATDRNPDHLLKFASTGTRAEERKATVPEREEEAAAAVQAPPVAVALVFLELPRFNGPQPDAPSAAAPPPLLPGRRHVLLI